MQLHAKNKETGHLYAEAGEFPGVYMLGERMQKLSFPHLGWAPKSLVSRNQRLALNLELLFTLIIF